MTQLENQTTFASQDPIFQQPEQIPVDPQVQAQETVKKKKIRIVIFASIFGFLLILVLLILSSMTQKNGQVEVQSVPEVTQKQEEQLTPLQQAIKNSQDVIIKADPTVNDLPFPPINFEMTLLEE